MFKMKRTMYTETAHLLKDHSGLCKNFHGHSYKWSVVVSSAELVDGMIMDFSELKDYMTIVIAPYDHALVVDSDTYQKLPVDMRLQQRVIVLQSRPTAEYMAYLVFMELKKHLPDNVILEKVVCRETQNNEVCYSEG